MNHIMQQVPSPQPSVGSMTDLLTQPFGSSPRRKRSRN